MISDILFCEKIQDSHFFRFVLTKDRFCSPGVSYRTEFLYIGSNGTLSFDRDVAKLPEWQFEEHLGFGEARWRGLQSSSQLGVRAPCPGGGGRAGGELRAEEGQQIGESRAAIRLVSAFVQAVWREIWTNYVSQDLDLIVFSITAAIFGHPQWMDWISWEIIILCSRS